MTRSTRLTHSFLLATALVAGASATRASEADAILQALVKKGVLSQNEAARIQDDASKQEQQSDANKIKLSNSLTELRIYGDARLRYQYDNTDPQVNPALTGNHRDGGDPHGNQRDRVRFRLRLDADFKLTDNWFGGVQIQTGYPADTGNQTATTGFSNYPLFVSRVYVGWNPAEWLTLIGGKQPNPFYTTELVWDPDINPSGFVEQITLSKLFGHQDQPAGLSKDGKTIVPAPSSPWYVSLTAGQFIFDDNPEGGGRDPGVTDHDATTDAWLFESQLQATYRFNPNLSATIAPAWMVYTAANVSVPSALTSTFGDFNSVPFVDTKLVSGATRNLSILTAPGDVTFKLWNVPTKIYWDVAYNLEGGKRFNDTYHLGGQPIAADATSGQNSHRTKDDLAWLAGLQIGQNVNKGDLSLLANWREVGVSSIDPNLNDSEFGLSYLNMRGFRLGLNYSLSSAAVFSVNYYGAWNLKRNLIGGEATGDNAIANANSVQVLEVDLNVKF